MGDLVHKPGTAPIVGRWDHALLDPNLEDAPIVHALDTLATVPLLQRAEAAYRAKFRLKSWQYMTAASDELFVAFVVGTAGFASNSFVYAVELATGQVHEKFAITPLSRGTTISGTSAKGGHRFATRGLTVAIENLDSGRSFGVRIDARTKTNASLTADLAFSSGAKDQHLSLCVPLPGGRWNYTHKFAGFGVSGTVTIAGKRFELSPSRAFGTLDFTKMYALRHSVWKWIALSGLTKHGKVIGLNFVDPTPEAPVSENAVWVDGVREDLTDVTLKAAHDQWSLTSDGVDVNFRPIGSVSQTLDAPLVAHKIRHIVGAFTGRIRTKSGLIHDLDRVVGIAEDFDSLW
ncbi:hypothetical protein BH11MYX2_BH11MYX2_25990 [soil metagenome]